MPMIDVIARAGTFADKPALVVALARAMMKWEQVPPLAMFSDNTATFIHHFQGPAISVHCRGDGHVLAGRPIAHGIVEQVDQHLAQRTPIHVGHQPTRKMRGEANGLPLGERFESAHDLLDLGRDIRSDE